jgi:hypothetical protein
MRKAVLFVTLVAALGAVAAFVGTGNARAYGRADQPIAEVEISANCDNPGFFLCAPPPDGVGLGGVWVWSELDSAGGDGTSGTMDATVTFCGHQTAGLPNGAFGHPDSVGVWWTITSLGDAPSGAFPFFDTSQTYTSYYVLDFFPGSGVDDFIAIVPASLGHYSLHPAPGVSIQTQVAP